MDEYTYKLAQNNSILTLNAVTGLVGNIRRVHKGPNTNESQKLYKFLLDQCLNTKNTVATSAMIGLISLTENAPEEIIPLQVVIKDVMSAINNVQNVSAAIDLIFYALFKMGQIDYDIMKNQHPLITILKKNNKCWPHILCKIEERFMSDTKIKVLQRIQPFALFVLYDFEQKMDPVLQLELLNIYRYYLDDVTRQKIILTNLTHISRSVRYCKILLSEVSAMATYLIEVIHILLQHDEDASEPIWILREFLRFSQQTDYHLEIVLLADCIAITPVTYLASICDCLQIMLTSQKYPTIVASVVKASLLIWKMHFSTADQLLEKTSKKVDALLGMQLEHNDVDANNFSYLDEKQYVYSFAIEYELTCEFLDRLVDSSPHLREMLFNIFLGTLYDDCETTVTLKALNLCTMCCDAQPRYCVRLLPVLLNKLSRSIQPDVHLALLKAIPKMGILKENLATIVMTIRAISVVSPQMHAFALSLMYKLVLVDKACFTYLEDLLLKDPKNDFDSELAATKAFVVRELCRRITTCNLEKYRKELASFVSKLLIKGNNCNLAIAFSFEALKFLCQGIDPFSTLSSLSERFEKDTRDRVLVGMCGVLGEFANITDLSDQKCEDVVKKLFFYTMNYPGKRVQQAAYKALSGFTLDQLALGFPTAYTHITNDNSILGSIAGACWVNLLIHGPRDGLKPAVDMLIHFIDLDLKAMRAMHYEGGEGHGEPLYMSLTRDNILGAIAKHVKKNSSKLADTDREVYIECLRILAVKYKRPLPPMDWTFLTQLQTNTDMAEYCVEIAANQSAVSGSARRLIEQHIKALTEKAEFVPQLRYLYQSLEILCNTIQPSMMKPFFTATIKIAVAKVKEAPGELKYLQSRAMDILKNRDVSECNRGALADVLMNMIEGHDTHTRIFKRLLPVVGCVPTQYLNEYCPVHYESINIKIMLRCLAIRSAAALQTDDKPFQMLDSVIDCRVLKSFPQPVFSFDDTMAQLLPVFIKHRYHESLPHWLHELMSRIELELADKKDMRHVLFACTVLVVAVVVASGYHAFNKDAKSLDEFIEVFPFGMSHLMQRKAFAPYVPQFLESLHNFATNPSYKRSALSEVFGRNFKHALLLMRTHDNFNDKFGWMKYIEVVF